MGRTTSSRSDVTHKEVDVLGETELAWLVTFVNDKDEVEYWFPKSQCDIYKSGLKEMMSIPTWLYNKKLSGDE